MFQFFSPSRVSAGFVAVLVGYTSSVAIILQAAEAAGATPEQMSSWLWALGIGMALSSAGLSLAYRSPVLTAWSTPGAALLVTGLSGFGMAEATGAFLFSSLLITIGGFSGGFARIMRFVPQSLASAMLAGVLLPFCLNAFISLQTELVLVGVMLLVYLFCRRLLPRYAIPLVLLTGIAIVLLNGQMSAGVIVLSLARPVFVTPEFSLQAVIGVGLPLFVVTMASQNIPGIATLRANGYQVPLSPLIGWTGVTGLVLAPFGGFAYNLAAITAAICQGESADPDPNKRYIAVLWAGIFYLLTGLLGAAVVAFFVVFPKELVFAVAGFALLSTVGGALSVAVEKESEREAAILTFIVTASGISLFGIGAAFWGLAVGLTALLLQKRFVAT